MECTSQTFYQLHGIALDTDNEEMTIDLSQPRKIRVIGIDPLLL